MEGKSWQESRANPRVHSETFAALLLLLGRAGIDIIMRQSANALALLALTVIATPVHASSFTLSPAVAGVTFSIENLGTVADLYGVDGVSDTYALSLTLTTNGYLDTGSASDLLAAFSVDFSSGSLDGIALVESPDGFSWTLRPANEVPGNSAQCGGDEPGAGCVEELSSGANVALATNATYSWLFYVDIGAAGFADSTALEVSVATLKSNGKFQGNYVFTGTTGSLALTSPPGGGTGEDPDPGSDPVTAPVPEPASFVLLGSGLLFAASRMRRGKK